MFRDIPVNGAPSARIRILKPTILPQSQHVTSFLPNRGTDGALPVFIQAAELKAKALSLKAELQWLPHMSQAGLEKDNAAAAEKKAPKQFASKSAKAPASASTK
eukprot:1282871-Pyramimonas_sp.AAC.1